MMTYQIGYFDETADGPKWIAIKKARFDSDAQAEAEIDGLKKRTPTDIDGYERHGLHIKRGKVIWFRPFSVHA